MGSTHTRQLTHRETLELLPWHVNASLGESLARLVESHVDECPECREESAVLAGAMLAISADEPDYGNADARFQSLMGRIRNEERARQAEREQAVSLLSRIAQWLQPEPQWAAAFTLGIVIGAAALFGALQLSEQATTDSEYRVLAGADAGLLLTVTFNGAPSAALLEQLGARIGPAHTWQAQGGSVYVVALAEDASVKEVSDVRSILMAEDSVEAVSLSAP